MIKTYSEAIKYVESYIPTPLKKYPGKLGLMRMKYFVALLGNPQLSYKTIHIGGTSGKGSTATITASILGEKYKVGLHTSPHLVRVNERIKISTDNKQQITNNRFINIPDNDFVSLLKEIKPYIERMEQSEYGAPSYFEIITAMAFLYFKKQKVDIGVIEVGMGGRLDGTNVVKPEVAILTNVGLDHTEILGKTVEEIAKDKAGIIKDGGKVVSGAKQPSVIDIIKAKKQNAKISLLGKDFSYKIRKLDIEGSIFDYHGDLILKNLKITMLGKHQIENACLAIKTVECLNAEVTEDNIRTGLAKVFIPGRLQIVSKKPLIILDGAHNEDKMEATVSTIDKIFPQKRIVVIVAIKRDKNAKVILQKLVKVADVFIFTQFVITHDLGKILSFSPDKLEKIAKKIDHEKEIIIERNPEQAVERAKELIGESGLILITGSLYLVGRMIASVI